MTICLVTDRRRQDPIAQARAAAAAGVDLIQVRERDLDGAPIAALVRAIVAAVHTPTSRTRVVVNDRLDVALACGADGVHLRADSIAARSVRAITPAGFLVGRSIHGADEARAAGPVDYLIAGTVFRTGSKDDGAPLLGSAGLADIVRAASAPVLAIGGMTVERAGDVAAAGAAGIAAIGLFAAPASMADIVDRMRARFDTVRTAP